MIEQINLTVGELKASIGALRKLAATELPVKAAYRIGMALARVEAELKLHNETTVKLVEQNNGIVLQDGTIEWEFDGDEENFNEAVAPLDDERVSIVNTPVEIGLLGDNVNLNPALFMATSWLFTD